MKQPNSYYNHNNSNIHIIDERDNYFSYILSPFKNKNYNKPVESNKIESAIKHGDSKKCQGDIDCEAEVFIQQKHKKLEYSKTTSF